MLKGCLTAMSQEECSLMFGFDPADAEAEAQDIGGEDVSGKDTVADGGPYASAELVRTDGPAFLFA